MAVSVVIPVWNGSSVISECLASIYRHAGDELQEVICVDNGSADESAGIIATLFPQVRLIRQPVNLGFAGGVNVGIAAAEGEVFVLLNQDCEVEKNWLTQILAALQENPSWGVVGCTILERDGSISHAGAFIEHPSARGVHRTEPLDSAPHTVEYVTGTVFAIRRSTWETTGPFDEGFFPAYYEECDYCFRVRQQGQAVGYVPAARVRHFHSSEEWQADPIRHAVNQFRTRYRFVSKHFSEVELTDFFSFEKGAIAEVIYIADGIGRVVAAQSTLRLLPSVLAQAYNHQTIEESSARYQLLASGFRQILHGALLASERLNLQDVLGKESIFWQMPDQADGWLLAIQGQLEPTVHATYQEPQIAAQVRMEELENQAQELLAHLYPQPSESERGSVWEKRWQRFVARPYRLLFGCDNELRQQLDQINQERLALLTEENQELTRFLQQARKNSTKDNLYLRQIHRRLQLMEIFFTYDSL